MYLCMMCAYQALQHIPRVDFTERLYHSCTLHDKKNGIHSVNVTLKKAQALQMLIVLGSVMVTDKRQQCLAKIRMDKSITTTKTNS